MIEDMLNHVTDFVDSKVVGNKSKKVTEAMNKMDSKGKGNIYFYAHNAGKFDLKVMLKAIYKVHKSQTLDLPIHISDPNHDIYQITIKFKGYNIIFRDSMKLLLTSVANLNDQMLNGEFPKIPMNLDFIEHIIINGEELMISEDKSNVEELCSEDSRYGVVEG